MSEILAAIALPLPKLDPTSVLGAMLAPALLMTGTAGLLTSANARLARVVDRLRVLLREYDHAREEQTYKAVQILRHRQRSKLILQAVSMLYASMASYVGCSLALAFNILGHERLNFLPIGFSILGVSLMLLGCIYMWREVRIAMMTFNSEIDYEIETHRRPASDSSAAPPAKKVG
ncbi:DUF2721 domain-containing protein [Luteimonas sp. FXH3W]|jgi:hypothetical protein|uniref:DUF2721 domain-containing protein n=1 Tax=Aquilutibacter rugosus TaxID=3115820 RepID=A0ABU7V132_9GAMM